MQLLKRHGVSSGSYRRIFSGPYDNYPPRVRKLVDLMSSRARRGISTNLQEWRAYAAIDTAYDVPFQQTTPTLIRNILGRKWNSSEELKSALDGWGLNQDSLFIKESLPDGRDGLVPNAPVFFGILIPLVKAYVTIRLAKIFNERNLSPLLEYKPLKETSRNHLLCDIITDLVQTMSTWYGYPAVMRQCIQQMLKYGVVLTFPYEEWNCQEQVVDNELGGEETVTVKEGLRYVIPHPTRMFYDLTHPLTTINSDTGVSWCGHWTLKTYGDILDSKDYWNRKSVFSGTNWFKYGYGSDYYFQEFFPCAMASDYSARFGGSTGTQSREDKAAWYNNSDRDQAVFLTEFFMKLVPSDWGLGEYDGKATKDSPIGKMVDTYRKPVWHRFTLAGDDTVIWAEPMAYCPSWFMGYHYDAQAGRQDSLGLQAVPWQDLVGDLLNHMIDVAKQNLANCTFYDTNVVDKKDIERINKLGSRLYKGWNFLAYDSLLQQRAGAGPGTAFQPMRFDKQSIVELLQVLPVVLNIMERILQITAQEVGSTASHQQGKEEILQTGSAATNGVMFTASYVDEAIDAWKRQLYDASIAYMDSEVSAQVSSDIEGLDEIIAELGFHEKGRGKDKVLIGGHKNNLRLEGFAASNQGPSMNREKEVAQIIFSTVGTVAGQPELFKKVGAKNLLSLLEQAAKLAGAPRDFKLNEVPEGDGQEEVPQNIIAAIQQAQQATMQAVSEKIAKPAAQEIAQDQQKIQQIEGVLEQLKGIYQVAAAQQDKTRIDQEKTQVKLQLKAQESQAGQQRKMAESQAAIARETAKAENQIAIEREKASAQIQIESVRAAHGTALAEQTAESDTKPKGE